MDEHQKAVKAMQQVEAMTGFYIHLAIFILVMILMFVVNRTVTPELWWVQWPLLGWGLGVVLHGVAVFGQVPRFIADWQLRKVKELKDKM